MTLQQIIKSNYEKSNCSTNMTLDGICDHTVGFLADEELHQHYAGLLDNAGVILYGRTTYQLMQFWPTLLKKTSGQKSMDDFALPLLVFFTNKNFNISQQSSFSTLLI